MWERDVLLVEPSSAPLAFACALFATRCCRGRDAFMLAAMERLTLASGSIIFQVSAVACSPRRSGDGGLLVIKNKPPCYPSP